ncbi:MAG: hypothetical protein PHG97_03900 [Candidatus Margulisbacteria bacterium]|nr:hypothetical protein [Candidatus Margulisiibacteriota bacterium]
MQFIKLLKKILLFLPVLVALVGFNYFVDPANLFRSERFGQGLADILLKGRNAVILGNYEERLLQKYYIDGLAERKDLVVLGSSRTLQINSDMFPGRSFFNNSVSGVSIEDLMAVYWQYRKKDRLPAAVIIGLDPWLLNKNQLTRYWAVKSDYDDCAAYLSVKSERRRVANYFQDKYFELFSPSYFQLSFWYWLKGLQGKNEAGMHCLPTADRIAKEMIKLSDGSINYGINVRSITPSEVRRKALADPAAYSLEEFTQLDPGLKIKFERLVQLMLKDGVRVSFFLVPYHPLAYHILTTADKYKIILAAENYYLDLAAKQKIKTYGSYNPAVFSLSGEDFYDGMHAKGPALRKILKPGT